MHYHTLLLTGAAGALGVVLRNRLGAHCDILRLSDLRDFGPAEAGQEVVLADLADPVAVDAAVSGCQAIVHFGAISTEAAFGPILQSNLLGVHNLYEAARRHGVKRIVFASSNHVTGYYRQGEKIDTEHAMRPDGLYGLSKAFGENLSRLYFDRYGIETACLRIGSCQVEPQDRRMLATWISHGDLYRLVAACLTVRVLGHTVIYGVSDNRESWWDNSLAAYVGYVPQDSADVFRDRMLARTLPPDPSDPASLYQGGVFVRTGPFD
jgi:uronate dehydrogenase